jgi:hypothetical protein
LGARPLLRQKVFVEPIGHDLFVASERDATVAGTFTDDEFTRHFMLFQLRDDELGLLDGHKRVGVAVNDESFVT